MTSPENRTGTDRVAEAARARPGEEIFVNVQGDCPLMPPGAINHVANMLHLRGNDMATLCTDLDPADVTDTSVVKVLPPSTFTRAPVSELRHIGIYAYTRAALAKFAAAPQSENELREGLEQLRAVDIGLDVGCYYFSDTGPEVNHPSDIDRVLRALA
jgi:3-deoxy-manno-octulosonate cytidylyltransferase (CMP-KDO synthetase)